MGKDNPPKDKPLLVGSVCAALLFSASGFGYVIYDSHRRGIEELKLRLTSKIKTVADSRQDGFDAGDIGNVYERLGYKLTDILQHALTIEEMQLYLKLKGKFDPANDIYRPPSLARVAFD